MKPREAMMTSRATSWNMSWKNSANASTFIFSSRVKLPRVPIGDGHGERCRAFVIPRPIMSIVMNDARPVPTRATAHKASGRLRQPNPRTADARAVTTRIVSGRNTVYSDRSEPSEDPLGPRRQEVEQDDRHDAEDREGERQDGERGHLEPMEVRHRFPLGIQGPEDRALHCPDVVRGGEDDREDRHEHQETEGRVDPDEDAELRDEPDEAGKPEGGEERDHHKRGETRRFLRDPAEVRDVPRADLVAEGPRDHEERRRHEAMGEHLEDRPREAEDRPAAVPTPGAEAVHARGNPEGHEPHVAHAGEGDEPLEIVLRDADEGPVEDRDDADEGEEPVQVDRRGREHLDVETDEPVSAELQEDAREDHGT